VAADIHLMHIFSGFGPGGAEVRIARIMNGMGPQISHTVLSLSGETGARAYIDPGISVEFPAPPPGRRRLLYFRELQKVLRARRPDLLLTYNWGGMDGLIAGSLEGVCPIVHNECGFAADEVGRLKSRRIVTRRLFLRRTYAVAVTSRTMRDVCMTQFGVPAERACWIRTGVDAQRFRPGQCPDWRLQIGARDDELLFGYLGRLRPEKNIGLMMRAFAAARIEGARLILIGDGPSQAELEQLARELGIAGSVVFAGHAPDPVRCLAALDVFVMSSSTEQTSNALLEAMACGLPALSTDVGDSSEVLGSPGEPAIVPAGDLAAYTRALTAMAESAELRAELGAANRRRCATEYPVERMVREYEALYRAAASSTT
jgi:L-malate glycosyltransferase